jgi:DNA-binding beta-propeller fold protein YncE
MLRNRLFVFFVVAIVAGGVVRASAQNAEPRAASPVVFEAPAGRRPAGQISPALPFDRVLPSGRIIHPAGLSVVVGMNAQGVALSPDGRYAIVSNDDERQAKTVTSFDNVTMGGYSLAVVDTATMRVVDRYRDPSETFFAGIVVLPDPANAGGTLVLAAGGASKSVYALDLDAFGHLTQDAHHIIAIPGPSDDRFVNAGHSFPATIVLSPSGARAYVVDNVGGTVTQIDVAARAVVGTPIPVGYFPLGAAYTPAGLLVANEGIMPYAKLHAQAAAPAFESPPLDLDRASSVSFVTAYSDDSLGAVRFAVPLDRGADGTREIGGTHPAAIVAMHAKPYAFVAMANVDRIATLSLASSETRAVGGTELRLYDRGPYGTQPVALALSPDEKRLYVALAGIDAIAVLDVSDPLHPHRVGLIPAGWSPSALALSHDGRYLFVANAKGYGSDRGFSGDQAGVIDSHGRVDTVLADSNAVWSTLERIDTRTINLRRTTPLALASLRAIRPAKTSDIVPQVFASNGSGAIKHVVVILEESKTYDAMLGDLKDAAGRAHGPGNPDYVAFDESVTPNLHALARTFALAGNMYADADESGAGHQFASAGIASDYTERTADVRRGRRPVSGQNQDPEDYPRSGYIFNSLALRGKTYRDYGDLLRVTGYDDGEAIDPRADDPPYVGLDDMSAATLGLGGRYTTDVPAPLALLGHVDLSYPGWNLRIRDVRRAAEFMRDFDPLVRADTMPAFTSIWLPDDHGGAGPGIPPLAEEVADGDRALGQIVDYLTRIPQWRSTAIFVLPADAQTSRDHLDTHRSYALVISPFAKRGYVGMRHTSTVSVLKTEEEILGLPALSLGDALATDLSDFFTPFPTYSPYLHTDAAVQSP